MGSGSSIAGNASEAYVMDVVNKFPRHKGRIIGGIQASDSLACVCDDVCTPSPGCLLDCSLTCVCEWCCLCINSVMCCLVTRLSLKRGLNDCKEAGVHIIAPSVSSGVRLAFGFSAVSTYKPCRAAVWRHVRVLMCLHVPVRLQVCCWAGYRWNTGRALWHRPALHCCWWRCFSHDSCHPLPAAGDQISHGNTRYPHHETSVEGRPPRV